MIHPDVPSGPDSHRTALLCRIVRSAPTLLGGLRWWLGFTLTRLPRSPIDLPGYVRTPARIGVAS